MLGFAGSPETGREALMEPLRGSAVPTALLDLADPPGTQRAAEIYQLGSFPVSQLTHQEP